MSGRCMKDLADPFPTPQSTAPVAREWLRGSGAARTDGDARGPLFFSGERAAGTKYTRANFLSSERRLGQSNVPFLNGIKRSSEKSEGGGKWLRRIQALLFRVCPNPRTRYLVVVSSRKPMLPRA
jgi:hypothetical protein